MKKVAVFYSENSLMIDVIKHQIGKVAELSFFEKIPDESVLKNFDYKVAYGNVNINSEQNFIRVHKSLLPSFSSEEPVKEAFLSGVKVTGITVYYTNPLKILAQYPVFIHNEMHYEDLKNELDLMEQVFFPQVLKKIILNEVFDSQTILNKGSCGGCQKCRK